LSVFVGRDKEMDLIDAAVANAAQAGERVALHTIDGMPGSGKTALAVHVAHRLAERFPDGQLFFDLHAHTPGHAPVQPSEALAELLAADGVDPRFLPATVDGRAGLWRDRTAGRRQLLVFDNAASTRQVVPLLPGSPGSLVLVTSRRSMGDLPSAVPMLLDVLAPDEATAMFVRLAPRAADDPAAVAELVAACGHLPLAISIVASLYLRHPAWTITDLHGEVQRSAGGPLMVAAENRTVAAVFDLSYQHLPADQQRFFRLLGLHLGVEVDAYAASALTDTSPDQAARRLDQLHHHRLLEEPAYRRYRMHDLIRAHAHTLSTATDPTEMRDDAVRRLLDFYQHTAARADAHLARHTRPATATMDPPAAAPQITSWEQAATWMRAERANLLACIQHTTTAGLPARTTRLTAAVASLLHTDGPWNQAVDLHRAAVTAAQRLGDQRARAGALHDLGYALLLTGAAPGAADQLSRTLELFRTLGDRRGVANTLDNLGAVRLRIGDYPGAADLHGQALDLHQALGDRRGEAVALGALGSVQLTFGNYPGAADLLGRALNLHRSLGDRRGEARVLRELGSIRRLTGDYPGAADLHQRSLDLHQALGDRHGEAVALGVLGSIRSATGDYPGATDLLGRALDLHRAIGSRLGEAFTLDMLGIVRRLTGDYPGAFDLHHRSLDLLQEVGSQHDQAIVSTHLAVVAYVSGDHLGAADLLQRALTVVRAVSAPDDEAEAMNHLAIVHRLTGQPDRAQALHHQALGIARNIHYRLEEAHAREGIGRAALDQVATATATIHLRQALDIFQHLGVPDATRVSADLATLNDP
jgi:tetratricopeptide (TPR) repeat protein